MNIITLVQNLSLQTGFKITLLIMIAIYFAFTLMLFNQVQALGRVVFFPSKTAALFIRIFIIVYILAVVSLFFLTLVIV
jgi:hypothetical protein